MKSIHINSIDHRATVTLFRAALGLNLTPQEIDCVGRADPFQIMSIATSHGILQTLAPAVAKGKPLRERLEPDAVIFLEELFHANKRRNIEVRTLLTLLGAKFARYGWQSVVLKGGAFLALRENHFNRYISDIDIILPEAQAFEAQDVMLSEGWDQSVMSNHFARTHHHLPALIHTEAAVPVEIHLRLGQPNVETTLSAAEVISCSESSKVQGIKVPSRLHRIQHLGLHAQLNERGWLEKRLRLRDVADFFALGALSEKGKIYAFGNGNRNAQLEAFRIAATRILSGRSEGERNCPSSQWADFAIRRLSKPKAVRFTRFALLARDMIHRLAMDSEFRNHCANRIRERGAIVDFIRRNVRRLREIR